MDFRLDMYVHGVGTGVVAGTLKTYVYKKSSEPATAGNEFSRLLPQGQMTPAVVQCDKERYIPLTRRDNVPDLRGRN